MIPNNNISPLPFYKSLKYQNHRKSYAYGRIFPLYAPLDTLLPFQIITPVSDDSYYEAILYNSQNDFVADITSDLINGGLTIKSYDQDGYNVVVFPGVFPLALGISPGEYYIRLESGSSGDAWYSEIFTVVSDVSGLLKIDWWDTKDLVFDGGRVVYEGVRFHNIVYLCSQIGKPLYNFEEEGTNRDGYFFPELQISEKTYKFTFLAPEYLCDVLRTVRLSDYVLITDQFGEKYRVDSFLMTVNWETDGDLASVETEFQTDTVIKKVGKLVIPGGDFNSDYDNDFNNIEP